MRRHLAAAGTVVLLAAGALVALPSTAIAAADPVIDQVGDTVTYVDPALAREDTTSVEGTLQIAYIDRLDRSGRPTSEAAYAVLTDEGDTVPIEVAEDLPASAANGAIEAEVVDLGSDDAQLAQASVATASAAASPTGVAHRAYVVLVPKTGLLPSESEVATRLRSAVLDEWTDEAEGAISNFTVAGTAMLGARDPATQTRSSLCAMSDYAGLWAAGAARFPGVDFEPGSPNHLLMLLSGPGCSTSSGSVLGIGTVGSGIDDGGLSTLLWNPDYVDATGVHELGHNFSLGHANVEGAEYYNLYSVMGFGTDGGAAPALDSLFRDRLGLDVQGELASPGPGTETTIELVARGLGSGLRGISVKDPEGGVTYWIDYRSGVGRDVGSTYAGGARYTPEGLRYEPGVVVYRRAADYAKSGDIDVLKREEGSIDATSWTEGETFTSSAGRVSVTVLGTDGDTASVRVRVLRSFVSAGVPRITGTARVGQRLTATPGTFVPSPTSYRYQWLRNGVLIPGSAASTRTATASDRGARLSVRVTGVLGGRVSRTVTSPATSVVAAGQFTASSPSVGGNARVGAKLRAVLRTYSPAPTSYKYQWYWRGNRAIKGATSSTFTVSSAYRGEHLRVRVTGVRAGYTSKNTISAPSRTIASGVFSVAARPSITGTARVGSVLRVRIGAFSPRPSSYRYQWYSGSTRIKGAKSSSYRVSSALRGKKLRVRVTGVRGGFVSQSTVSRYSATVRR